MLPESDLNPYAAPQSDVTLPKVLQPSMPRPASTKWLLSLMWFIIAGCILMCHGEYQERGAEFFDAFKSLRFALSVSVMALIMVAFHAFKRSRITYALGVVYLLFLSYIMWIEMSGPVWRIAATWNQQTDKSQSRHALVAASLLTALFTKLCYHFIFGLPSRRFYRLTQK